MFNDLRFSQKVLKGRPVGATYFVIQPNDEIHQWYLFVLWGLVVSITKKLFNFLQSK